MITKDDDKGDDKKLKDQSKNNSSESRTIQEFKIRIKKNCVCIVFVLVFSI